jgi:hypothetical protein
MISGSLHLSSVSLEVLEFPFADLEAVHIDEVVGHAGSSFLLAGTLRWLVGAQRRSIPTDPLPVAASPHAVSRRADVAARARREATYASRARGRSPCTRAPRRSSRTSAARSSSRACKRASPGSAVGHSPRTTTDSPACARADPPQSPASKRPLTGLLRLVPSDSPVADRDARLSTRLSRKSGCRPAGLRPCRDGPALCRV